MVSFDNLKKALKEWDTANTSSLNQPLSDTQYNAGFDILMHGAEWTSYQDFIIPQLNELLTSLLKSRSSLSVLEIGPGSKSILGYLPIHLRRKIKTYTAFEPNLLSATRLEDWLCSSSRLGSPLPLLERPPNIYRAPFALDIEPRVDTQTNDGRGFNLVLFCHSMYGMNPKHKFVRHALDLLVQGPEDGKVVIFHRDEALDLDGLACERTAIFPTAIVTVDNDDEILDNFVPFIGGYVKQDVEADEAVRSAWIKICRALTCNEETRQSYLSFSSPQRMVSFNRRSIDLPNQNSQSGQMRTKRKVKNWEARLHQPTDVFKPTTVQQVQQLVQWALEHNFGLTIIGGGHSGHCMWPNVVSVDMEALNQVHIIKSSDDVGKTDNYSTSNYLVVAEAGCKTGDIVRKVTPSGFAVPLGSRPSVGAGLWLQGGIGHLTRLHGLACDSIVGAVIVSVDSGQVFYVGQVPTEYVPAGGVRPKDETDLLWAIRGAGTNFGVVISVTFKAYPAPTYSVRNWVFPMRSKTSARKILSDVDSISKNLPQNWSIDAYLYWDFDQLHIGVTTFEVSTTIPEAETPKFLTSILGLENKHKMVDGVGLFETEMYMSEMHGGHGCGKTSSFKRCLFLKSIAQVNIANILLAAIYARPSPLCYFHLLQGGAAVHNIATEATAFGCRDWKFACVITGVWPCDQNGTETAQTAVQWVYDVGKNLLPFCCGVYGADLGPDPRDKALAAKAFGPNLPRLASLKRTLDPQNVIAYACPLQEPLVKQKLVILVTGDSAAGKDYCADIFVSEITACPYQAYTACSASISDVTKREYATATGADPDRLLSDRSYKEKHRQALTVFYHDQVARRPQLPMEHFQNIVHEFGDVDVLLITGMRDEAPVATFAHLVPDRRLLDVQIKASQEMQSTRKEYHSGGNDNDENKNARSKSELNSKALRYRPSLIFDNEKDGSEAAKTFAKQYLLPFLHDDLARLAGMVRAVPDSPRPGILFRHVLDISQQAGGLTLVTTLLQNHFSGEWTKVDRLVCCETGGYVFASPLAMMLGMPLALIRESGKLPPPTISTPKSPSHISSTGLQESKEKRFEMNQDLVSKGTSVVIVDDVLATGKTLCAVLQLLIKAGVCVEDISIMVVAEFPVHRGREMLRQQGFGAANIQSLLVFNGF
ncbi:6a518c36-a464-4d4f-966a-6cea4503f103 [Sclerotinia trifoliorum]|uniref:6a518c36-a464-4d4f-966a-6cea4503f103 n=1 Tax=Sclerotinia trifoliorum TaxID=28548 RepID=A0A8H2VLN0_9HELO|nr:6a518c36-a464-4d4f-966a-6cea4503f103 [Sclerotinia trifoliorum]